MEFEGIKYLKLSDISPSQLYISAEKLAGVEKWFSPEALAENPLPVRDFGNGRYTLTDGHTRALCAYRRGMTAIPCVYDRDPIVADPPGPELYRMDTEWCARFGIFTVADLASRVVSGADYARLWRARCDAGYELMTRTSPAQRAAIAARHPGLFLWGMSTDAKTLYFEDASGAAYAFSEDIP